MHVRIHLLLALAAAYQTIADSLQGITIVPITTTSTSLEEPIETSTLSTSYQTSVDLTQGISVVPVTTASTSLESSAETSALSTSELPTVISSANALPTSSEHVMPVGVLTDPAWASRAATYSETAPTSSQKVAPVGVITDPAWKSRVTTTWPDSFKPTLTRATRPTTSATLAICNYSEFYAIQLLCTSATGALVAQSEKCITSLREAGTYFKIQDSCGAAGSLSFGLCVERFLEACMSESKRSSFGEGGCQVFTIGNAGVPTKREEREGFSFMTSVEDQVENIM